MNQTALVTAEMRSHRTAMDALGTESPEEELARVVEDRVLLGEDQRAGAAADGQADEAASEDPPQASA